MGQHTLSRVWSGAQVIADNLHGKEIAARLHADAKASAWGLVSRTDHDELSRVCEVFGLDDMVLADLTSRDRRVKYEEFGDVRVLTTRMTRLHDGLTLVAPSVSLLITSRLVLIFADEEHRRLIGDRLAAEQDRLAVGGSERAAQVVMHGLADSYFSVIDDVDQRGETLADAMFEGRPLTGAEKLQVFQLRRAVTELRRTTEPMREIVDDLAQSYADDPAQGSDEDPDGISRSWTLVVDHQTRVSDAANGTRESLGAIFDTSLALDGTRMDEVMKKLTGWAAILAAPTLITGFVGMNVPFWLTGDGAGFYVYLAIMVAAVVVLFVVMKRKQWI